MVPRRARDGAIVITRNGRGQYRALTMLPPAHSRPTHEVTILARRDNYSLVIRLSEGEAKELRAALDRFLTCCYFQTCESHKEGSK